MERKEKLNLSMLFDFYEMTMANGYFRSGMQDRITYFDVFFRRVPDGGGFAIAAGLEQLVDYIRDLHFDEDDIAFLRSKNLFQEDFLAGFLFSVIVRFLPCIICKAVFFLQMLQFLVCFFAASAA